MSRIFITGSSDGLGSLAAQQLIAAGHSVVLHARNKERAETALQQAPGAERVLIADLADMEQVKQLADDVNALGYFDAIIHNAGVMGVPSEQIFAVNSLAPFILTACINPPQRLIYLGSGMHMGGNAKLENIEHETSYSDSKFQILLLMKAVARRWPQVLVHAVDPGWVPTKMGGASAPDNIQEGAATQVWLATSDDNEVKVSGQYFFHKQPKAPASGTEDEALQDAYIERLEVISGIELKKEN